MSDHLGLLPLDYMHDENVMRLMNLPTPSSLDKALMSYGQLSAMNYKRSVTANKIVC